jgi:EmrB/QacA subfamily drug resistance transporter
MEEADGRMSGNDPAGAADPEASADAPESTGRLTRSTVLAMVAMGLAVLIIANDFTAFSVAIPSIEKDLHTDLSTAQWVVNAYAVVFGVAIVTGGRLADMIGRRTIFFVGAGIFALFSLAGGLAPDVIWLIVCRAVMGIGGALMWPAIMGMTYDLLPPAKAGLAGGLILGAAGLGNAIGPLLGGLLTTELSWRWIFFLNLPIVVVGVTATFLFIRPDRPRSTGERLDYRGVATLTVGLVALLLALDFSSTSGWASAGVIALMVISPLALVAFVLTERRAGAHALVPPDVMTNSTFMAACGAVLLMSAVFFSILLYVPQFMVRVLGWSPLSAGAGLLPMMITFAAVSFAAGPLYVRVGPRVTATSGAACITVGIFCLSLVRVSSGYGWLIPGMVVCGAGVGLFYSSISTAAVTALDPSRSSLAGGVVYMCQVGGGSIGLGVNTAIVLAAGSSVSDLVRGIEVAFLVDAALALSATLVTFIFVGTRGNQHPSDQVHQPVHHRQVHRRVRTSH